jgi:cytochrome c-type biogenesis protein CcmH/NrfG
MNSGIENQAIVHRIGQEFEIMKKKSAGTTDRLSSYTSIQYAAIGSRIVAVALLLLVHGCGFRGPDSYPGPGQPERPAVEEPSMIEPHDKGPAHALFVQARQALSQGNNHQAELALERALRIEPGNPVYWHAMGRTKYRQSEYAQAIQFCLKSKSLAGKNRELIRTNDQLILKARQASAD